MASFPESVIEYKKQLEKGYIQVAYRGLMGFILDLKSHLKNTHPEFDISGSVYPGYMDMTYFPIVTRSLKSRKLKIAIVFIHETLSFEAWLAGVNKQVQKDYRKLFEQKDQIEYRVSAPGKGVDSIVEYDLVTYPDFSDPDTLITHLENGIMRFVNDIESFIGGH
ncbi:hypothetical protein ABFB09_04845 [Dehalogenimonas sp. THU2]|uniref:DUF7000 family protein n=1 Tax=Dehalogenimonas sp. THU2 TaxID=3151121 RepID=UPI003218AD0A